jgi:tRNA pseudouridine55 synthase/H/ACA ribonucleoprotein complex subunit 4
MLEQQISTLPLPLWSDSGLLIIDKPRGPSSHQVTAWVGKMLGCRVGHSGTLDPQVSGVLLIMLGNAVRLAPLMLKHEKEYVCLMRLHDDVSQERLEKVIKEFVDKIYQRPPRKSAVKRSLRIRTIYKNEILDLEKRLVLFKVHCDAGTYIRSLCHHIGLALGTGAHMQELRRTQSGSFDETQIHTLHELKTACIHASAGDATALSSLILPVEAAVPDIPRVVVRNTAIDAICHGAQLAGVGVLMCDHFKKGETVTVLSQKNEFICLGTALLSSTEFKPGSVGLVIAPTTVFMKPGTYSQGWKKKRHEK